MHYKCDHSKPGVSAQAYCVLSSHLHPSPGDDLDLNHADCSDIDTTVDMEITEISASLAGLKILHRSFLLFWCRRLHQLNGDIYFSLLGHVGSIR